MLSEESKDDHARLQKERVWIVDPLDGTKEFIARNGEFSIMIGLAIARPCAGRSDAAGDRFGFMQAHEAKALICSRMTSMCRCM